MECGLVTWWHSRHMAAGDNTNFSLEDCISVGVKAKGRGAPMVAVYLVSAVVGDGVSLDAMSLDR